MGKQRFDRTKKALSILLLVLFVMSITATAVSAVTNTSEFGPISKQNYLKGYEKGANEGSSLGYTDGTKYGDSDCQTGKPNDSEKAPKKEIVSKSSAAYDLGYADGHNFGYSRGFFYGYNNGYDQCVKSGNQNKQFA